MISFRPRLRRKRLIGPLGGNWNHLMKNPQKKRKRKKVMKTNQMRQALLPLQTGGGSRECLLEMAYLWGPSLYSRACSSLHSGLITPGGFSSVPAGMETPELIELRKKKIEEAMDG